jgi:hypothetical protein
MVPLQVLRREGHGHQAVRARLRSSSSFALQNVYPTL